MACFEIYTFESMAFFVFRYEDGIGVFCREKRLVVFFHDAVVLSEDQLRQALQRLPAIDAACLPPQLDTDRHYLLPNVEIMLTEGCQLRCAYCYSDATELKKSMDVERAHGAIDFVFRNALIQKRVCGMAHQVRLGFTGGGEPTFDSELLLDCLRYAKRTSEALGLDYSCTLQTNGQIEEHVAAEILTAGIDSVAMSWDGLKDVQDSVRPRSDGASSFDYCSRFARMVESEGIPLSIRTTLTTKSERQFPDFVRYINRYYPSVRQISIDSISLAGRGKHMKSLQPSTDRVCASLHEARVACSDDTVIAQHGVRLDRYGYYCSPADLMSTIYVSASQHISICQESTEPNSKLGSDHIVGAFEGNGNILISKHARMHRWATVSNSPDCMDCVALYFCAGGCKSRISFDKHSRVEGEQSLYWCELTKRVSELEIHDAVFSPSLYPQAQRFAFEVDFGHFVKVSAVAVR